MISLCQEQGFEIPVWRVSDNVVTVTFPGLTVPFDYSEGITEGITEGLNKLITSFQAEGINEGTTKGITETMKESLLAIIELLIKNKSLRVSEIAVKLNKPYKTIERHIKTLMDMHAIQYEGSKKAGGYQLTEFWNKQQ